MRIPLFYFQWKVCFPHVWELYCSDENYEYYRCVICDKLKRKKKRNASNEN